jgi:hypothetical protein
MRHVADRLAVLHKGKNALAGAGNSGNGCPAHNLLDCDLVFHSFVLSLLLGLRPQLLGAGLE